MDSASSDISINPPATRSARGAIAAQACDTCRARKQRCDEQRPKCGLCQRMKLECRYREPQPTKKDKTLVEILDRLKTLETKVDRIPLGPSPSGYGPSQPSPSNLSSLATIAAAADSELASGSQTTPSSRQTVQHSPLSGGNSHPYRHASAAHKMLTWPAIQQLLLQSLPANIGDLTSLEQEGSAFIVRMQQGTPNLPMEVNIHSTPFIGMQTQAARASGGTRMVFPTLTRDKMQHLATAYFDTFNFIYPFMDRQIFLSETMAKVYAEGFNGDPDSVIALLVFALGEMALEGTQGPPVEHYKGRASGVRGGTITRPPGLEFFNAARERMGFVLTECDLESVQIFSLAALYYESCSRHVDFWRLTVSASQACQVLVTCYPIDWNSLRGDLIKRAYWHCAIMET
ncbi:hypothetical protein PVAG01_05460 [Phlyctema vagabunda]|uniref:Zn(2)-C6 fungal-type domain-containing protein n=1 Tax=Phlyctema vagabunda TaxID=108571 RepID=A0ABR4PKF7_9HELO